MVTVFDLMTGETRELTAKKAPRRSEPAPEIGPQVLPRLQEHTFAQPQPPETRSWQLAGLDCEAFIRSMEKR